MAKKNVNVEVNEFDETIQASKTFFEKYQKQVIYGGGAVLAIIIGVLLFFQFYVTPRNNKANESLFQAGQLFMSGEYEKALNGDGQNLGFLAVADQFGGTKAANLSKLYAGICYAQTGKYEEAVSMLQDFDDCGDDMVSPSAIGMLGNLYAELGQTEKAVTYLLKAADKADNNIISPIYLMQAGQIYESLGKTDDALNCYKKIQKKYQQSRQYAEVDKYIERLSK